MRKGVGGRVESLVLGSAEPSPTALGKVTVPVRCVATKS